MNIQRFIVHDYIFLAIIRLNGFTIRHIERGVVHLYNIFYQSVRLLGASEIFGKENRNFCSEDNQEMQV